MDANLLCFFACYIYTSADPFSLCFEHYHLHPLKFIPRLQEVMVCQAASQTKFRALKHESGIPGRATIIVRVIACFQPLQNCQAEYFRQLLKPVT
nr:transcription factor BHLH021 [Ipomoea batatas]